MTPLKPWEIMNRQDNVGQDTNISPPVSPPTASSLGGLGSRSLPPGNPALVGRPGTTRPSRPQVGGGPLPPPLPPPPALPPSTPWRSSYFPHPGGSSSFSSSFHPGTGGGGAWGLGGYGGGNPWPPFTNHGYGGHSWSRRHQAADEYENRFVQLAEESTQTAFSSVEALVRSFSSIAAMLESTYHALYLSFRAVLSVAENMSRLKRTLLSLIPGLTALRTVLYFYRRILSILGVLSHSDVQESAWKEVTASNSNGTEGGNVSPQSPWPAFAVFSLLLSTPYLLYRLATSRGVRGSTTRARGASRPDSPWTQVEGIYDFEGGGPNELPFKRGERIYVSTRELASDRRGAGGSWLTGVKGSRRGLIPSNRIKIVGGRLGAENGEGEPGRVVRREVTDDKSRSPTLSTSGTTSELPKISEESEDKNGKE